MRPTTATLRNGMALAVFCCFLVHACDTAVAGDLRRGSSFFDPFDEMLSSRWLPSDGWTNGDWQNCEWSRNAVSNERGHLILHFQSTATNKKRSFTCGEVQSRRTYGHGTFEARIRTQSGSGLNSALFTYIGPPHGRPHHEIDVEILLRDTSAVSLNTYVSGAAANGARVDLPVGADDEFITYSFTWSASGIVWYVEGKEVHRTSRGTPLPNEPMKIYLSFWGSDQFGDWMGKFRDPGRDLSMAIDWIAYTELGFGCAFAGSVLCTQKSTEKSVDQRQNMVEAAQ